MAIFFRVANVQKASLWKKLESEWDPLMRRVLSGESDTKELLAAVEREHELYFINYLARYSRRFVGDIRKKIVAFAEPFLSRVVSGLTHSDPERRARAVQTLAILGGEKYVGEIAKSLTDSSPLVAMVAARALASEKRVDYVDSILSQLTKFRTWNRSYLVSMLVMMGADAGASLRNVYRDERKPHSERALAANALAELLDFSAADSACEFLSTETNPDIVSASLRLLASVGRKEHLPSIRDLCASNNAVVRSHALTALGNIGDVEDRELLAIGFEDKSIWVALHAAWALKAAGAGDLLAKITTTGHPRADLAKQVLVEKI